MVTLWAKNFDTIQNPTGVAGEKNNIKLKKDLHYRSLCDILAAPIGSGIKVIPQHNTLSKATISIYYKTMTNDNIAAAVTMIASNSNVPASERALLIGKLLKGKTFKAVYHKAKPDLDENGNEILREAFCSLNYDELKVRSNAYKAWLEEQEWKKTKGIVNRKEAHEYGNVQYWDMEKDSFRNFKVDNLVSVEIID